MVKIVVLGTGFMGRGIAACCAAGGNHEIVLWGRSEEKVQKGVEAAETLVELLISNGVAAVTRGTIIGSTSLTSSLENAAFVFESIVEDVEAKQELFHLVDALCPSECLLYTNTSSLPLGPICEKMIRRERFAAAHFIGPAHLVPLVEVCPALNTAAVTVTKVVDFLSSIGKKPVVLKKEIRGHLAARLQAALYREALNLVQQGVADPDAVDSAVVNGFGRRLNQIGPFTQGDFAGVDLIQKTHATLFPELGAMQRDLQADELVSQGRFGVKSGAGCYEWPTERVQEVAGRRDRELLRRLQQDVATADKQ